MVNSGIIYLFNIFCAEKYHIASNFAPENNATHMKVDYLNNMQIAVCESPGGNGMRIDHMPDFLLRDDFDDMSLNDAIDEFVTYRLLFDYCDGGDKGDILIPGIIVSEGDYLLFNSG